MPTARGIAACLLGQLGCYCTRTRASRYPCSTHPCIRRYIHPNPRSHARRPRVPIPAPNRTRTYAHACHSIPRAHRNTHAGYPRDLRSHALAADRRIHR